MYFSVGAFGSLSSFSITGFFFGGINRGVGFLIEGGTGGGGVSFIAGCGCSNGVVAAVSAADSPNAPDTGASTTGSMSIFGAGFGGSSTCSRIAGGGARNGSGIG